MRNWDVSFVQSHLPERQHNRRLLLPVLPGSTGYIYSRKLSVLHIALAEQEMLVEVVLAIFVDTGKLS